MNGFACPCGWIGAQPEILRTSQPVEFWGDRTPFHGVSKVCPECDGDELLEVHLCEGCEEQEAEPGYDDCRTCLAEKGECEGEFRRDQIAETRLLLQKEHGDQGPYARVSPPQDPKGGANPGGCDRPSGSSEAA